MESAKAWWVEVSVYVGSTGNVSLKVAPIMKKKSTLNIDYNLPST